MTGQMTNGPHLPEISIRNFRCVQRLAINRLGRVTLLVGRNGAGRTTVLEAVRVYASRAHPSVLRELLEEREEFIPALDRDQASGLAPSYAALFHGRTLKRERPIRIGPKSSAEVLSLEVSRPSDWPMGQQELFADLLLEGGMQAIKVVFQDRQRILPWIASPSASSLDSRRRPPGTYRRQLFQDDGKWPMTKCGALDPGLPDNLMLARYWDRVALTEGENLSLRALRLAFDGIEQVALVGDERSGSRGTGRRVIVKLRGDPHPVSLSSLGDGAARLFAAGLALANSSGGFLVIDEVENGIHYSIQPAFWTMVLRAARQHNVQVLATTHSSDCVKGFAYAVEQVNDANGALVRLERHGDRVRAVEYTEEDTVNAGKRGIEVR